MKKIIFFLFLYVFFAGARLDAQVTDSVFVTQAIKPYLYTALPKGTMMDSKGNELDFINHIKTERVFKDKPTLLITWSNRYCPPCIALIDSMFGSNMQKRYNLVLINKDQSKDAKPTTDALSLVKKISEAKPAFNQKAISLFDNNDIFKKIDEDVAPMIFWLDRDLNIAGAFLGFGISIKKMEEILEQVDGRNIAASKIKYQDNSLFPATVENATMKQTMTEASGMYSFTWDYIDTKKTAYQLNFIKTAQGIFQFHKSSLNVPKVKDLYNEAEIIAGVKKMLSSLNTTDINAVKAAKGNNDWYGSKLTIKNFNTAILDNKDKLIFSNSIAYPALDKSSSSKKLEFHTIANALSNTLSISPKKEEGKYDNSLTYTYKINNEVVIFLIENAENVYFNLVANKDKDGNVLPFKVAYNPLGFDVLTPPDIFLEVAKDVEYTEKSTIYLNNLQWSTYLDDHQLYINKTTVKDTVNLQSYYSLSNEVAVFYSFIKNGDKLILKEIRVNDSNGKLVATGKNLHTKRAYVLSRDGFLALLYMYKEGVKQDEFYISEGVLKNGCVKVAKTVDGKIIYGVLKPNAEILIPVEYGEIKFENNIYFAKTQEDRWGALDLNGKIVVKLYYDKIEIKGKLLQVQNGKSSPDWQFGLYNFKGEVVAPFGKEFLLDFDGDDAGLSYVQSYSGLYGYINREGVWVIKDQFSAARPFKDGLARVKNQEGKYGYINATGETVIPFKYTAASDFYNGKAGVSEKKNRDGEWDTDHEIDKKGVRVN